MNSITNIPNVNKFYDRNFLVRAQPLLVHDMFAQIRNIPTKHSGTINFRKYSALALATTPLTPGVTPGGSDAVVTDITAQLDQYGDYMPFTDTVTLLSEDPVLAEFTKMLGEQAGQTLDVITRDKLMAGTNVQYANNAADRAAVDATDVINQAEVNEAVLTLKNANAQKLKEMVKPDAGYETRPIIATYVGIIHPNTTSKLVNESNTKWISVEKYANKADIMPGEVGALGDVRFIETTYAKVYAGAGTGPVDVYATLILGRDAYGTIALEGNSMEMIFKPIGSAGATDPLNQRGSIGWKSWKTAKILQELFMIRVEHAL